MPLKSQLRFALIDLLTRLLSRLNRPQADPADIYYAYRLILGRPPPPADMQYWRNDIRPGMSKNALAETFLNSAEFRTRHEIQPELVHTPHDFAIWVDGNDELIGQPIIATHAYEPHVTAMLQAELRPDSVFVDIGANMGWFSLLAASIITTGRVIAIEPNWANVQLLYRSLLQNDFRHVTLYPCAITAAPTILELQHTRSNGRVAAPTAISQWVEYSQGIRLDDLLAAEPKIDVIKMDIEGHEPIALGGMLTILRQHRPVFLTEFHPHAIQTNANASPTDYLGALIGLGYQLAVIESAGQTRPMSDAASVMAHWRAINHQLGTGDSTHLDLIGVCPT